MDSAEQIEMDGLWGRRRSHDTIAYPNCGIYQPVEVEYDGGQGYASPPLTPCSVCQQDLCAFCDQAKCECGQTVCLDCTIIVPDVTSSGLRLCKPCAHEADPLCPACGEFARMLPRQNSEQQWFECTACGAAMDEDEIAAAQQVPAPRRQPESLQQRAEDFLKSPREEAMRRAKTAPVDQHPAPVQTKFLRLFHAVPLGHRIDGWRVCWVGGWDRCRVLFVVMVEAPQDNSTPKVRR